jgi:hypothetical protein
MSLVVRPAATPPARPYKFVQELAKHNVVLSPSFDVDPAPDSFDYVQDTKDISVKNPHQAWMRAREFGLKDFWEAKLWGTLFVTFYKIMQNSAMSSHEAAFIKEHYEGTKFYTLLLETVFNEPNSSTPVENHNAALRKFSDYRGTVFMLLRVVQAYINVQFMEQFYDQGLLLDELIKRREVDVGQLAQWATDWPATVGSYLTELVDARDEAYRKHMSW